MESRKPSLFGQMIALGDFLSNFVASFPHPVHIKDAKTGKYIFSNQATAEIYGLKSADELIGLTEYELTYFQSRWGAAYAKVAAKLDRQAKTNKQFVQNKCVILTSAGFIRVQEMVKIPVLGVTRKVNAVFTYSYDLTPEVDLFSLFKLYKRHYPKKQAIKAFLKYLNIAKFFIKDPTETEMLMLLAMRSDDSQKYVASLLDIGAKTVETHRSHLRRKLKDANFHKLLVCMRSELPGYGFPDRSPVP
ncbi:MAG: LuxR C-terminal-related transcriptional regulator [Gammaproteobacteria bacterium]